MQSYLDKKLPKRCNWTKDPIVWLQSLPNFLLFDFFGGYVKNNVCSVRIKYLFHIKESIRQAIESGSTQTSEKVCKYTGSRFVRF